MSLKRKGDDATNIATPRVRRSAILRPKAAGTIEQPLAQFARSPSPGESIQKLGQWPTWQIIPEENRSFTKD
jgi:hypothetical protein